MIIEDEPDAAELFAEMMRLNGYRVLKAYAGGTAMALLTQEHPDVVLLDVMMPDISGIEVLRSIRSDPNLALTPVVIVSALANPADISSGLSAGASAYLTKPVSYVDLVNAVGSLVNST
ncbi:MAG: response regulator transcription factor [Anaerolineae bacterium]